MKGRIAAAGASVLILVLLAACSTGPGRKWSQDDYLVRLHSEGLTKVTAENVDNFSSSNCASLQENEKASPTKGALTTVIALGIAMNLKDIEASKVALETVTTQYCPDLTSSVAAVNSASA